MGSTGRDEKPVTKIMCAGDVNTDTKERTAFLKERLTSWNTKVPGLLAEAEEYHRLHRCGRLLWASTKFRRAKVAIELGGLWSGAGEGQGESERWPIFVHGHFTRKFCGIETLVAQRESVARWESTVDFERRDSIGGSPEHSEANRRLRMRQALGREGVPAKLLATWRPVAGAQVKRPHRSHRVMCGLGHALQPQAPESDGQSSELEAALFIEHHVHCLRPALVVCDPSASTAGGAHAVRIHGRPPAHGRHRNPTEHAPEMHRTNGGMRFSSRGLIPIFDECKAYSVERAMREPAWAIAVVLGEMVDQHAWPFVARQSRVAS